MRHARPDALDTLEPLLNQLRNRPALRERTRGVFYKGSRAWLHFHEDPAGLFADLRDGDGWRRVALADENAATALLRLVDASLGV